MSSLMKRRRRTTPVIYKQSTCVLAIGLVCLVTGVVFFLISVGAQLHLRLWQLLCVGFAGSGGVLVVVGGVWCGCSVHRDKVNNPASFYHHTMHRRHVEGPCDSGVDLRATVQNGQASPPMIQSAAEKATWKDYHQKQIQRKRRIEARPAATPHNLRPSAVSHLTPCRDWASSRPDAVLCARLKLRRLESAYLDDSYPDVNDRTRLALDLGVNEDRIQVWFQNRRARGRRNLLGPPLHAHPPPINVPPAFLPYPPPPRFMFFNQLIVTSLGGHRTGDVKTEAVFKPVRPWESS
ncbi:hypothetical protein CAPTEDRAFT_194920 [Capitella teleta]|uniref:Homeobox domain-containing protein n=1 Tax=Capitella teleta TaxID=283909 RepID=R7TUR1_CAPTE|nr:hypothetical protein CAPTEDRAFT_194920 [Capitella teleta]|eukprot:ELT97429.1 hypothetical protein CAPTEDRAFT_194920 [Capitella teleta]